MNAPRMVNLQAALATFDERWSPRRVAKVNDYDVKVVKVEGELMLLEPAGVVNTGDAGGPLTAAVKDL